MPGSPQKGSTRPDGVRRSMEAACCGRVWWRICTWVIRVSLRARGCFAVFLRPTPRTLGIGGRARTGEMTRVDAGICANSAHRQGGCLCSFPLSHHSPCRGSPHGRGGQTWPFYRRDVVPLGCSLEVTLFTGAARRSRLLTSRRARVTPQQSELPASRTDRRRVPGLPREEAAMLAGISSECYVRLERGDGTGISGGVLDGIVHA